ncbi:MAG: TIGR03621 family F420-dependent LLM class oxidoreductase [Solirubrobacterales bacterium]
MNAKNQIRIGLELMRPFEGRTWIDTVREVEDLGYASIFFPDHFDDSWGPITALASAAAVTTKVQLATAVFCTDFRHPAVLAHELTSIDQVSQGRLEVGLGAGYMLDDYQSSGIPRDRPGVRVSRLIEQVAVLRGLFAEGTFDFDGEYYKISGLQNFPAPYRAGGPPIFVAGGGPRMLRFAARHADIIGVNPFLPASENRAAARRDGVADRIDEKFTLIREMAGDRYDGLVFHAYLRHVRVTDDRIGYVESVTAKDGLALDDALTSPFILVGSVDEIVGQLLERRERWGYTYYTVQFDAAREFVPVLERLAEL